MFDHVTIRVSDRGASEAFYELVLGTLGRKLKPADEFPEWDDFSLAQATAEHPLTQRLHVGFAAQSTEQVDEFWRVGTDAGYTDDGPPGPRPEYGDDYYGSFLLDPDGNSAEAVHHDSLRRDGAIDHLWIRVADLAAATRFYELIAPYAGLRLGTRTTVRTQFRGESGSLSLVHGAPTEHVHLAFAAEEATVREFHRAATEAGYRDNGGPGERAVYHAGYYGAFVLDPDGNNVELVDHHR